MPRLTKPLTNTEIKQAKPKATIYSLNDGQDLQLRIMPNGSKTWLFVYFRPHTKKRTSISFGSYPELTLAKARAAREIAREQLANDIDPQEFRDDQAKVKSLAQKNTLEHIAAAWLEVKKSKVSDDHATLNEEGFDEDVVEAALSHIGKNQVRNAYNRADYLERRKPMMEWWDNFIDEAATGNTSLGFKGLRIVT